MSAARGIGLSVPRDLSVVGFDDVGVAAHVEPPLTTVHQPIRQKGAEAARLLLAGIERRERDATGAGDAPTERLRLPTRLVVRGSTATPRHRTGPPAAG
jgi:DNA-binding LacI/PurR family transcriptional regulator